MTTRPRKLPRPQPVRRTPQLEVEVRQTGYVEDAQGRKWATFEPVGFKCGNCIAQQQAQQRKGKSK